MTLQQIKWLLFGRPELPPKDFEVRPKVNRYTCDIYMPRHYQMAQDYLNGYDIIYIANCFSVTRERVRQCLWKAYHELKK